MTDTRDSFRRTRAALSGRRRGAFTLIELVLVLAVVALAVGVVAPKLTGWSRGVKVNDAASEFVAATRYARSQAMTTGRPHRIVFDFRGGDGGGQYQVLQQDWQYQWSPTVVGEFTSPVLAPEGCRIEMTDAAGKSADTIDFFPNGRSQPGRFTVTFLQTGERATAECQSPAESYKVVPLGGQ